MRPWGDGVEMPLEEDRPGTAFPHWPAGIQARGEVRSQYAHAIDMAENHHPRRRRVDGRALVVCAGRSRHPDRGHRLGDRLAGGQHPATPSHSTPARSSTGQLMRTAPVTT
jgi:hypothetical protein